LRPDGKAFSALCRPLTLQFQGFNFGLEGPYLATRTGTVQCNTMATEQSWQNPGSIMLRTVCLWASLLAVTKHDRVLATTASALCRQLATGI